MSSTNRICSVSSDFTASTMTSRIDRPARAWRAPRDGENCAFAPSSPSPPARRGEPGGGTASARRSRAASSPSDAKPPLPEPLPESASRTSARSARYTVKRRLPRFASPPWVAEVCEKRQKGVGGGEESVRNRRAGRGGDPNAIRQTVARTKAVGRMNRGDNSPGAGRTERRISIPVSTAPAIVPARRLTPESSRVFPVRGRRRASVPCERAGAQFWVAANWAGGRPNRRGSRTTTDRGSSVVQCRIGRVGVG